MQGSTARRLAWGIGGTSLALQAAALLYLYLDRHGTLPNDFSRWSPNDVLDIAVNMAVPVLGIVLATRRRDNLIGWLFLVAGAGLGVSQFAQIFGMHLLLGDPGSVPGLTLAWLSNWIWPIPAGMLAFLFLLFPTGHLLTLRWRLVAWLAVLDTAGLMVVSFVYATASWSNPFGLAGDNASNPWAFVLFGFMSIAVYLLGFVSVFLRYRRSTGDERLQMKWFVTAAATVAVTFSVPIVGDSPVWSFLSSVSLLFLYVAIGIAILKYRLYEIDVVISRAVIYGTLAAFITLIYVGLVVGVGAAVGNERSPWLSALAAAIVAVAFQPVRQWARKLANRVVYGRRASPYEVLSDFAERISGVYANEDVLPRMAQIVAAGTGAASAVVWLRVGAELEALASSNGLPAVAVLPVVGETLPAMPDAEAAFPVEHQGELLGAISVRMPAKASPRPGRGAADR